MEIVCMLKLCEIFRVGITTTQKKKETNKRKKKKN